MTANSAAAATAYFLACSAVLAADEKPAWMTQGPYVKEDSLALQIPLEVLATKLFVEVEVGGAPRRFVFDTGSPSMMSADLAASLNLQTIDKRQGRDAHGAIVDTAIVQSDLTLDGTTFHNVPMFVAAFPKTAQCLFDGVLGSELLPLCAWQIDLQDSALRCHSDLSALSHVKRAAKLPLHDFGYPHAPILDVQFAAKARSKALFDTGSPEYFAISPADLEGAKRNGGIDKSVSGVGSIGGSLGGAAPNKDQLMVRIDSLAIGDVRLGRVDAVVRESNPSLVGASILEHFIVTLDPRNASAYLAPYRERPFVRSSFGFGLDFENEASVAHVWDGSPAARAGLRVGQRVISINGKAVDASCTGVREAMQAMSAESIELEWEGGSGVLTRANIIAQ